MPRDHRGSLAALIGQVYEAALVRSRWQDVLEGVGRHFGCAGSIVFCTDFRTRQTPFELYRGYEPGVLEAYTRHWFYLDPGAQALLERGEGAVMATNLAVPRREWLASEYYNDFARYHRVRHQMGSLFVCSEEGAAGLAVQRQDGQRPFTAADERRFAELVPHLRRAFVLMRHMEEVESTGARLLSLVEHTHGAVLLLDAQGCVVMASPAAERILAARDGLGTVGERLSAADPEAATRLQALLAGAVRAAQPGGTSGGALSVPRPSRRPAYHVLVLPLVTGDLVEERPLREVCAAVLIREGAQVRPVDAEAVQALFELTPAEARVALGLVQGQRPEEIAAAASASPFTVRSQLSSIYEKLGVRRQAELVQRVLSSPAMLGTPGERPGDEG